MSAVSLVPAANTSVIRCIVCGISPERTSDHHWYSGPKCRSCYNKDYRRKNLNRVRKNGRDYYGKNTKRMRRKDSFYRRILRKNKRVMALSLVGRGKIRCINCGCNDQRLMEINHKNGGGNKDKFSGDKLVCAIISGRRTVEDLELTCSVCNILHYKQIQFGNLPFKILWEVKQD